MNFHEPKQIIGVGSPIVDTIAHVADDFLLQVAGQKGGMELVDAAALESFSQALPTAARTMQSPGGSAGNTLFTLARLGQAATFVGKVGNDSYGDFYRTAFTQLGGDAGRFKRGRIPNGRCLSMVTPDGQRTLRTDLGAAMTLSPDELTPADFAGCAHAHIEGYLLFNRDLMLRVLECAKSAGCTISLDLASFEVVNATRDILDELLHDYVDLVFANEEEAAAFMEGRGESFSAGTAAQTLAGLCRLAVVKVGPEGAWVAHGQECFLAPAVAVESVVDTTGAGDFWAAGFLYGWLRARSLAQCAHFGALLGAAVIQIDGTQLPAAVWEPLCAKITQSAADVSSRA